MGAEVRTKRVSHPVLRLEVLSSSGMRSATDRVFCKLRRESVPVDFCSGCRHCDAIRGGPAATVDCTIPIVPTLLRPDPQGERTEVGAILCAGSVKVVDESTSPRHALRLLHEDNRRSIAVVDREHMVIGIVHEGTFTRRSPEPGLARPPSTDDSVTSIMSTATSVPEAMPVRVALRLLAASHLRDATVIASGGTPLGLFRDIDGLRWIAHAHRDKPSDP